MHIFTTHAFNVATCLSRTITLNPCLNCDLDIGTLCEVNMPQSLIILVNIFCHRFYNSFICTYNFCNNPVCKYIVKTTDTIMSVIEVFVIYLCKHTWMSKRNYVHNNAVFHNYCCQ